MNANFRLNVLNPGGRDPEQHFAEGTSGPGDAHAPVNFHAYAACTRGSFLREPSRALTSRAPVLLLLRGDFKDSERALSFLKKAGLTVAVSLKETGLHQIAEQLADPKKLSRFMRIMTQTDGCLAPTAEAAEFYGGIRGKAAVAFIPTPYPLHDPAWDFSRPLAERRGIFIGTREWDIPSRHHLAALLAARQVSARTGEPVGVFNLDGRKEARLLASLGFGADQLRVLTRELSYPDYLRTVSAYRIVFQLDGSFVPGQVAGDALLCRMPCVGGNGTIDRIAFREFGGGRRPVSELVEIATGLMQDAGFYQETVAAGLERAAEELSFNQVARQLQDFFAKIAAG